MSQDIISDALSKIMNAKRAGKERVVISRFSKVLLEILEIAQNLGYIEEYKTEKTKVIIKIGNLIECNAIKPRNNVTIKKIEKYMKRYLPARDMGVIILSTNKGLMTHSKALEQNIGGCLVAYFY